MMEMVKLPDGVSLCTQVDGPVDAPWIVLSNSLGASLAMWDGQIDLLTRKYRVLRYDQRGHGQSDAPVDPYSFELLVGDVIALMDHYDIDHADFIGLSMGAMTGMGLALGHSDRLGRIVLADSRAVATEGYKAMWDKRITAIQEGGVESIADASIVMWLTEGWRNAHPAETAAARAMIVTTNSQGYIASCYALRGLNYLKDLGSVTLPVLYICGADDKGAPPEEMQEMARVTSDARYVEILDAGHVANINQPDDFNAAIADFLKI
tara:strand:- start:863 stop:1657 length:795 start_codon:yes stop_codon:yes gene_type:complete